RSRRTAAVGRWRARSPSPRSVPRRRASPPHLASPPSASPSCRRYEGSRARAGRSLPPAAPVTGVTPAGTRPLREWAAMSLPTNDQVNEALRGVIAPELRRSIVELGMVRSIEIQPSGRVEVVVSLTTAGCPIRSHFEQAVAQQVKQLDGVTEVAVGFDVLSDEEKGNLQQTLGRGKLPQGALAQVKNVICVASGKGGVGKSTMTANLAAALCAEGHAAGALDCDVYGYSIPRMLGVNRKPEVNAERKILPLEAAGGVKVMSIGFFVEENSAVVWRGPMLHKAIQQFLEDVAWGELEYLLLDLPPGTGDVSMTLSQLLPQAKFAIVTTPQPAAQTVAKRAADMAVKFDLELL